MIRALAVALLVTANPVTQPSTPLTCSSGQALTATNSVLSCISVSGGDGGTSLPPVACAANQVLTFDGGTYACVYPDAGIPSCAANQVLTGQPGSFTCVYPDGGVKQFEATVTLTDFGYFSTSVAATWVNAGSKIACTPLATTQDGLTPETITASGVTAFVANRDAGNSVDVWVWNPNGLYGTLRLLCVGY